MIINILHLQDLPSEITSIELEPSTSITNNIDFEVQNEQTVTTSTYVDTERKIEQLKNEENILSVKVKYCHYLVLMLHYVL